ncbi:MAG: hypothetical protein FWE36_06930 [Erysipelotrichales bacterium]|nr:hypothetical protein [Erysipelotrichales bacterium]
MKKINKNVFAKLLSMFMIIIVGTATITLSNLTLKANTSGTELSASTQAALNQSMSKNTFVHEGSSFRINQYYTHLYGNRGRSANSPRVVLPSGSNNNVSNAQFNITDPITSFIPVAVFQELTSEGVRTFIGEEWGVIIDVFFDSHGLRHFSVQVIDILITNNLHLASRQYILEIRPLFEVNLAWINAASGQGFANWQFNFIRNGPVGLYAVPQMRTNLMMLPGNLPNLTVGSTFENSRRNYIANFAFSAVLENEQNANPEHNNYIANSFYHSQDFGHFFRGNDLHFNAFDINELSNPRRRDGSGSLNTVTDAIRAFAGFVPLPGMNMILFAWDIADVARDLIPGYNLPEAHFNHSSSNFLNLNVPERGEQIHNYGKLIKNSVTLPTDSDLALTLHGSQDTFARGIFEIHRELDWQGNRWISRLNVGFNFDVRSYQDNITVATGRGHRLEILGDERGNYRPITAGQPISVYNHNQNTSRFRFTAPATGVYSFDFVNPNHRNSFRNFSRREVHLSAGQTFYLRLEYLHNDVSIFDFFVDRVNPSAISLELNQTRNITSELISGSREFVFFNDAPRFVRIVLSGGVMPWEQMLVVRNAWGPMEVLDGMGMAKSSMFSTEVTVFLPHVGNFFIDTQHLSGPGQIFLRIEEVQRHVVDFSSGAPLRLNIFRGGYGSEMHRVILNQDARFNVSIPNTPGLIFIIYKFNGHGFDWSNSHWFFNGGSGIITLPAGTYYMGYFQAPRGWSGNINITRVITSRSLFLDAFSGIIYNSINEANFEIIWVIINKEHDEQVPN